MTHPTVSPPLPPTPLANTQALFHLPPYQPPAPAALSPSLLLSQIQQSPLYLQLLLQQQQQQLQQQYLQLLQQQTALGFDPLAALQLPRADTSPLSTLHSATPALSPFLGDKLKSLYTPASSEPVSPLTQSLPWQQQPTPETSVASNASSTTASPIPVGNLKHSLLNMLSMQSLQQPPLGLNALASSLLGHAPQPLMPAAATSLQRSLASVAANQILPNAHSQKPAASHHAPSPSRHSSHYSAHKSHKRRKSDTDSENSSDSESDSDNSDSGSEVEEEELLIHKYERYETKERKHKRVKRETDGAASARKARTHGEQEFKCTHANCDKTFTKPSALKRHERTHTGERPFVCAMDGCHMSFAERGNLKRHIKVHLNIRPYQCRFCDKSFGRKCHQLQHERSKHTDKVQHPAPAAMPNKARNNSTHARTPVAHLPLSLPSSSTSTVIASLNSSHAPSPVPNAARALVAAS